MKCEMKNQMSFDEDLVYAIIQDNTATLESLNLSETMVNQPIPFTPKVRASPNSFVLPSVAFPTPLVYAICCRQPKTVTFLLKKGARLDIPVGTWYPIHFAVASRDVRVVEAILNVSAESELERRTTDDGATPLHVAVSGGQLEVVLFLLRHGCDANCVNGLKQTPLHLATAHADDLVARALLAYRANPALKDAQGRKPSDAARARNNQFLADTMTVYESGAEPLPEVAEIEIEAAQHDVTRLRERMLKQKRNRAALDSASSQKIDDVEHRLEAVEQKIEQLFEGLAKVGTRGRQSTVTCAGCFAPNATVCPQCGVAYCETCAKKERVHKCAAK